MIYKRLLFCLFFIACLFPVACDSRSALKNDSRGYVLVTKVVDGDTFYFDNGNAKDEKARLIGVDAPESRAVFKKKKGYYGKEAKTYLKTLLIGQQVKVEYDIDRKDQYGRALVYVYLENGTFVNAELVKQGYAMVMTVSPNVKYASLFLQLQREAREKNRGLWRSDVITSD